MTIDDVTVPLPSQFKSMRFVKDASQEEALIYIKPGTSGMTEVWKCHTDHNLSSHATSDKAIRFYMTALVLGKIRFF